MANSQQAHDVLMTSMRRNNVASTSFRRHVPTRFLTSQCQIITFLVLKSDILENSRLELRGIVLPLPSNQIKVIFIIILPFNLVHLCFFPVSHRNGRKMWVNYWGGQRVCWPPSQIIGGLAPPPPPCPPPPLLPTPMTMDHNNKYINCMKPNLNWMEQNKQPRERTYATINKYLCIKRK